MVAWCHGIPGIALVRLQLCSMENLKNVETIEITIIQMCKS